MIETYTEILKRLYILQFIVMDIDDYEEDDYQALQHAVDYFEDKLDVE